MGKHADKLESSLARHRNIVAALEGLRLTVLFHASMLEEKAGASLPLTMEEGNIPDDLHVGMVVVEVDTVPDPGIVHKVVSESDVAEVTGPEIVGIEGSKIVGDKAPSVDFIVLKDAVHTPEKHGTMRCVMDEIVGDEHPHGGVMTPSTSTCKAAVHPGGVDKR